MAMSLLKSGLTELTQKVNVCFTWTVQFQRYSICLVKNIQAMKHTIIVLLTQYFCQNSLKTTNKTECKQRVPCSTCGR